MGTVYNKNGGGGGGYDEYEMFYGEATSIESGSKVHLISSAGTSFNSNNIGTSAVSLNDSQSLLCSAATRNSVTVKRKVRYIKSEYAYGVSTMSNISTGIAKNGQTISCTSAYNFITLIAI